MTGSARRSRVATLRQIGGNDIIGTTSAVTDADGALVCTASATLVHRARRHERSRRTGLSSPRTYRVTRADLVRLRRRQR